VEAAITPQFPVARTTAVLLVGTPEAVRAATVVELAEAAPAEITAARLGAALAEPGAVQEAAQDQVVVVALRLSLPKM
jgi:hypothetical protein